MKRSLVNYVKRNGKPDDVSEFMWDFIQTYDDLGDAIAEMLVYFADTRREDQAFDMLKSWIEDFIADEL